MLVRVLTWQRLLWASVALAPAVAQAAGLGVFGSDPVGEWIKLAVLTYVASEVGPIKRRLDSLERKR